MKKERHKKRKEQTHHPEKHRINRRRVCSFHIFMIFQYMSRCPAVFCAARTCKGAPKDVKRDLLPGQIRSFVSLFPVPVRLAVPDIPVRDTVCPVGWNRTGNPKYDQSWDRCV